MRHGDRSIPRAGKAEAALRYSKPVQMFLNTGFGFGCFANCCVKVEEVAAAKRRFIVAAARILRERWDQERALSKYLYFLPCGWYTRGYDGRCDFMTG